MFIGKYLTRKIAFFREYNIPEPVTGGVLISLLFGAFVIVVVFRLMGKSYDAAVMSAGYAGLALGATPTAIANMTAVTEKYGTSPQAFLVIPLVGAFFIDIANAFIINFLLGLVS